MMARCTWDFTPKTGRLAGTDICILTGRPCIIDEPRERPGCTRAAMIWAWQDKHYPGQPQRAIKEATRQAPLPF